MYFVAAVIILSGLVVAVFHYFRRLVGDERSDGRRWFWIWVCKGLAVPLIVWMVWNVGVLPGLPALMPQIARAQAARTNWLPAFFEVLASAVCVIGSYWAAVSFAWFVAFIAQREEIRSDFLGACLVWSVIMLPLALLIFYVGGWTMAGLAVVLWLLPIANSALPLLARKKVGPLYSRAIAKIKMGKYDDAEWEVIHELEKCEDDFEGWMMLAELYATHFDDLAGAQRTVQDICAQPNATPSHISVALHRLADWQLKIGEDPVAARRSLDEICQRMPGTHLAKMARHRINQLPASREEFQEQRNGRTIHMPALNDSLVEETPPSNASKISRDEDAAQANRCVEKLKQDPDNVTAREELARLFAERLERPELGIEQIELLLEMPAQPQQKVAEWLSLMAAWQFKYRHNAEEARNILERLVREYPQSAQAFAAQRHLKLMEVESRMRRGR